MSAKSKGTAAERELIHLLWGAGFAAFRAAGSGSIKYPCPDIIAGNAARRMALECKATKSRVQYFSREEVADLIEFSRRFGAEAWLAIRFDRDQWYFLPPEGLEQSEKSFHASIAHVQSRALVFSDLVENKTDTIKL